MKSRGRGNPIAQILAGGLICGLSLWLGLIAARPFQAAAALRARNDNLERQLLRYRLQNQRIEKETIGVQTRAGLIYAARKLGYVWPGERPLRIPGQ